MPILPASRRRSQAERSAAMRDRLVDAATASLVENGYAHTTSIEVCARAGVTRGALGHHFPSLSALLVEVLERLYAQLRDGPYEPVDGSLETFVRQVWERVSRVQFKAIIEIWLAARNDPELGAELRPAIAQLSQLFSPAQNPALAKRLRSDSALNALYRLAIEAMIGLALGRATSPDGRALDHEGDVLELLAALARDRAS